MSKASVLVLAVSSALLAPFVAMYTIHQSILRNESDPSVHVCEHTYLLLSLVIENIMELSDYENEPSFCNAEDISVSILNLHQNFPVSLKRNPIRERHVLAYHALEHHVF